MALETKAVLGRDRIDAMTRAGLWPKPTAADCLDRVAAAMPDAVAFVGFNSMRQRTETISWRRLRRLARRFALALADCGVGRGDVVSWQLPNWWEFAALHLACVHIGAISNPTMPIFRRRELAYMLDYAESKVFVVPRRFRGFDHAALAEELCRDIRSLDHVFVLGGEGERSFEAQFVDRRREDAQDADAVFAARRPDPDDVVEILYTSGTTGTPKGVMHTTNTLFCIVQSAIERLALTPQDRFLMASPMAHQTGFLYGMLLPLLLGAKTVLQDIWSAEVAARLIRDEAVTFTMAATPFLADLAGTPALERYDLGSLRIFVSAGAPIPRVLVETASQRLGARILSGWGMTENGLVTTTLPDDPEEKAFATDGAAIPHFAVRVVDDAGTPVPPETEGRLQATGAGSFVGYLKRPEDYGHDAEGWFETGDRARMDADGYIRITGRAKDIIIRGGENIPVVEVEELLYRHPAVEAAAVVAMPDPRLGERGCAFVQLREGRTLTVPDMIDHLQGFGLARTYLPERLEIVDAMPRTASGKIQKFELRTMAATLTVEARKG